MTEITNIGDGEYSNLFYDGTLRVSSSEEYDELLVYKNGQEEPEARFSLSTGELLDT